MGESSKTLYVGLDVRKDSAEARLAVFDFIEGWCNPRRRHSALAYRSPLEFEQTGGATPLVTIS